MGSCISKIDDDMDIYQSLCKKYNQKELDIYSEHYYWIIKFNNNETSLTYLEYLKINNNG